MNNRSTITLKILSVIIGVLMVFFSLFSFLYVRQARTIIKELQVDKATSLVRTLESSIVTRDELNDREKLQLNIQKLIWLNSDVIRTSINLPKNDLMQIVSSNDSASIGKPSSDDNIVAYEENRIISHMGKLDGTRTLLIITPLHVAGQTVGTYEILLSLTATDSIINTWIRDLIVINIVSLILLSTLTFILLRQIIVKPINTLTKAMSGVRKGNFVPTTIRSRDEIGNLSLIFNEMIKELKLYKQQTEKTSRELERKVEKEKAELNLQAIELNRKSMEMLKREQEIKDLTQRIKAGTLRVAEIGGKTRKELDKT